MSRFPYSFLGFIPALILSPAIASAEPARLLLSADTPSASVSPRNRERSPLNLPDLEFRFTIEAYCDQALVPASLSLAVADTRRSFHAGQIDSGEMQSVPLRVPAKQIAPVVIENFCVASGADESTDSLQASKSTITIRSALSAHASFLCQGDSDHSMTYASTSLDIVLVCTEAKAVATDPVSE
ncbi:MAG: hypothetical protein OEW68_18135 [Gammaproteobacteria bacterium]|nr:hypothetical protein [Gammaproteobacteria bacterium]MDH4316738.1 hypothetical protein [Gammaproteobacteria bacterium]